MFLILVGLAFAAMIVSAARHSGVNVHQGRDSREQQAYVRAYNAKF